MKQVSRKIVAAVSVVMAVTAHGYLDLGTMGQLYDINETNGNTMFRQALSELNITRMAAEYKESFQNAAVSRIELPRCREASSRRFVHQALSPATIIDPLTDRVRFHRGEPIPIVLPEGVKGTMCFIDGSDENLTAQVVPWIDFHYRACDYMVSNTDIMAFQKRYGKADAWPMPEWEVRHYAIDCWPTVIEVSGGHYIHTRIAVVEEDR